MTQLDATVRWQRNSLYYVVVMAIPTFLISIVTIFGMFTAEGTVSEKVFHLLLMLQIGLGLTNLLALSVMMGIVADSLPKSSEITVLGRYLVLSLVLGCLSVVGSLTLDFFVHTAVSICVRENTLFRPRRAATRDRRRSGFMQFSAPSSDHTSQPSP